MENKFIRIYIIIGILFLMYFKITSSIIVILSDLVIYAFLPFNSIYILYGFAYFISIFLLYKLFKYAISYESYFHLKKYTIKLILSYLVLYIFHFGLSKYFNDRILQSIDSDNLNRLLTIGGIYEKSINTILILILLIYLLKSRQKG